jgi:murein L,D-transpeptidase YafK
MFAGPGPSRDKVPVVDRIVILKSERTMKLYSHDKLVKEYKVALGGNPVGPKQRQGDRRTPEGSYKIDLRNQHSQFHLSLRVSYPNAQDREWARAHHVDPGGAIMIHGLPDAYAHLGALHRNTDWTDGCIAVTNEEIEEIWAMVPLGAAVEIKP